MTKSHQQIVVAYHSHINHFVCCRRIEAAHGVQHAGVRTERYGDPDGASRWVGSNVARMKRQ